MKYELPKLKYDFNALEPYIDEMTMNIHYSKHHAAYINNLNAALEKFPELLNNTLEDLLTSLDSIPESIRTIVRNNGGGHYNHSLFWSIMAPTGGEPSSNFLEKLNESFGGFQEFKEQFTKAAISRFGSGWVWLIVSKTGSLEIVSSPNQDSPIFEGIKPILGLDVWEHAYYLKYQNRRPDYIKEWWNVVDWKEVETLYSKSKL